MIFDVAYVIDDHRKRNDMCAAFKLEKMCASGYMISDELISSLKKGTTARAYLLDPRLRAGFFSFMRSPDEINTYNLIDKIKMHDRSYSAIFIRGFSEEELSDRICARTGARKITSPSPLAIAREIKQAIEQKAKSQKNSPVK
jgi:hypothetical protein